MPGAGSCVEHFQEKWNPVFRPKMRQTQKMLERFLFPVSAKPLQESFGSRGTRGAHPRVQGPREAFIRDLAGLSILRY
jgi:hypothetical protein